MEKKFTEIYKDIEATSPELVNISEELLEKFDCSVVEYEKMDTLKFCIVTFSAIFLVATTPAFFSYFYEYSSSIEPIINSYLSQLDYIQSNSYVNISSVLISFAVPFYTLVMPFLPKMLSRITLVKKDLLYFFYTIVFNYLAFLIPLMYIISYELLSEEILTKVTIYWLSVPGFFNFFNTNFFCNFHIGYFF